MTRHAISTIAWAVVLTFGAGFYAGAVFGVITSPAAYDAKTVERHLREVFCEQAVRHNLMTTCVVPDPK